MLWNGKDSVCKTWVKVDVVSSLLWNRVRVWSCTTRVRGTELPVSYILTDYRLCMHMVTYGDRSCTRPAVNEGNGIYAMRMHLFREGY